MTPWPDNSRIHIPRCYCLNLGVGLAILTWLLSPAAPHSENHKVWLLINPDGLQPQVGCLQGCEQVITPHLESHTYLQLKNTLLVLKGQSKTDQGKDAL